ncbi:MAG: acetyl-CoA carboxylase biotin carboxyl carrier protein [Bacteroidetes bacterium]|nr:acetyl-CoA carboxylase biotin carboxyl carrier protein [Bacteroidota bacterium]
MELKEIQELIKFVSKAGVAEVELESKGFKIVIKTQNKAPENTVTYVQAAMPQAAPAAAPQAAPAPAPAPAAAQPQAAPAAASEDLSKYITVKAPMVGTFYRRPSPDKPIFANVGDEVKPGTVLCIIEAMKLFNEIESEVSGRIVKILVDDASPVEFDQPLFLIDPS